MKNIADRLVCKPLALLFATLPSCSRDPSTSDTPKVAQRDVSGARHQGASHARNDSAGVGGERIPENYIPLFERLVSLVEKHHVFAENQMVRWVVDKSRLYEEFARAGSREDALVAVFHLQNSLRDRHCSLQPPGDLHQDEIGLGISLFVEVTGERTLVRVDKILDSGLAEAPDRAVAEGDLVIAVDGKPVEAWLLEHDLDSNSLNDATRRSEQANAIVSVMLPWSRVKHGDTRTLTLRREGTQWDQKFTFADSSRWGRSPSLTLDDAPSMASVSCRSEPGQVYPGFTLSSVGLNVCVYHPVEETAHNKKGLRLVRFLSFRYELRSASDGLRAARADHALLSRELADADAVILDLHENRGGNNPFVFLGWFADKPWDHQQIHMRVSSEFSEQEVRRFLWDDPKLVDAYKSAVGGGLSEIDWPFLCRRDGEEVLSGTCRAQGPYPSERVTEAPVAVISGPDCTSSCDSLVASWSAFSMGPVVGLQPAHGFTTARHSFPIADANGTDLGQFSIALSWEAFPGLNVPLEGAAIRLDWEAPLTFETRDSWVDLSIEEATRRLGLVRHPPTPRSVRSR